jgi:hypothetical protein
VLSKGDAFIRNGHVWFLLSDPAANKGRVLCANITSFDEECTDDECFLTPQDYSWIKHQSVVAFSRAKVWDAAIISKCIQDGKLKCPHPKSLPASTISKIVEIALLSRELSEEQKAYL